MKSLALEIKPPESPLFNSAVLWNRPGRISLSVVVLLFPKSLKVILTCKFI